ncbi:MAG: hypothetical protein JWQ96_700 [Segetibacter sp.]|nr:hypothetical protein [Segetibacter sp.]
MKSLFTLLFIASVAIITGCTKTGFTDSPDALLTTSTDTLHFDTVFTTTGSVTQTFKIFNQNDRKLRISKVALMGGAASSFRMNVDGISATEVSNIEVEPNDSVYVFVSVTINPNARNLAFVVQDSIRIEYNGNKEFVQLDAYGQNANFLRNRRITRDSTWNNNLPFVILGGLIVDNNATLTINKGTRIFCHADAPIIIAGTLKVNGEKFDSTKVSFQGDRLDQGYKDYPGSWPGIFFTSTSKDNVLNYAVMKNAYQGIITLDPSTNSNYKVTLNQCIIDNVYDAGVLSSGSSVKATNCLISNCGINIAITSGGRYDFTHCTVASFSNYYLSHKNPVLSITNGNDQNQGAQLDAVFRNCIFYGDQGGLVEDEIKISKVGTALFRASFENVLYKFKNNTALAAGTFNAASIANQSPQFDSVDVARRVFNFHLKRSSPAVDKGVDAGVPIDLDGNVRSAATGKPDIGCYELQ